MLSLLALALALLTLTSAQLNLPTCAVPCFSTSIAASGCNVTDYLCQCTTGAAALQNSAIGCLCKSDCTTTELLRESLSRSSNSIRSFQLCLVRRWC